LKDYANAGIEASKCEIWNNCFALMS